MNKDKWRGVTHTNLKSIHKILGNSPDNGFRYGEANIHVKFLYESNWVY